MRVIRASLSRQLTALTACCSRGCQKIRPSGVQSLSDMHGKTIERLLSNLCDCFTVGAIARTLRRTSMVITVRESDVKATPATIWKVCFADMKFDKWDPDVKEMIDVTGGCENGTEFKFVMEEGPIKIVPCKLSDVKENESLRFTGAAAGGMIKFDGLIEITPKDAESSHIKFSFVMKGLLGTPIMWLSPRPAVEGTEGGLQNMVRLSEEAQN
jgi:hypothetical protein